MAELGLIPPNHVLLFPGWMQGDRDTPKMSANNYVKQSRAQHGLGMLSVCQHQMGSFLGANPCIFRVRG